jgi:glycosyltransferase involved in cell wall biosynthesis
MIPPLQNTEVSVIIPARNEEANLEACLRSLIGQARSSREVEKQIPRGLKPTRGDKSSTVNGASTGVASECRPTTDDVSVQDKYEVIVVDDGSTDRTRAIAESFDGVRVIDADPLPDGWSGKCNACWSGAKVAKGKWLLFTDADTRHAADSIEQGLREAEACGAALLSYSPKQEVHGFWERALMPVVFAELAKTYRPKDVSDPASPAAAANGQYLLIRRDVYDSVGGHAAVARAILEDVELAKLVKQAGHRLQFRMSDAVSTRMYRNFAQMWEGWTKNLALLFPRPLWLAAKRALEFVLIVACPVGIVVASADHDRVGIAINIVVVALLLTFFFRRVRRAHFDWTSNCVALFGLPLFAVLLVNSYMSHKQGRVMWKGRAYGG